MISFFCLVTVSPPAYYFNAHSGPISCVNRSPFFRDILLTVGGCTWALWKEGAQVSSIIIHIRKAYVMVMSDITEWLPFLISLFLCAYDWWGLVTNSSRQANTLYKWLCILLCVCFVGVFFIIKANGNVDVWDLMDRYAVIFITN